MGWEFQQFSRYLITFCIKRDRTTPHQMLLDTRNKNIHGLGVGISTVFEKFGHFLYKGEQDHSVWLSTPHHHLLLDTRNKKYMV
jgi:hypothetical protein